MIKKISELSIFFPFWNEEENVEKVVNNAILVAPKVADKWEIIIIDDGSSDNTLRIAKKLEENNTHIRTISHQPNRGYGAALKAGFTNSKYKYIVFTDGDGQFDFSEVTRFIASIDTHDMVVGYRKQRHDHPFRHVLMNLLKIWDYFLFGFYYRDIDCGFKLFKKTSLNKLLPLRSEGAMITTEILAKAKNYGLQIGEVEVTHYPRKFGDQSGGNLRVILRAIKESILLWKEINYG